LKTEIHTVQDQAPTKPKKYNTTTPHSSHKSADGHNHKQTH
jgi:hypothetical protein